MNRALLFIYKARIAHEAERVSSKGLLNATYIGRRTRNKDASLPSFYSSLVTVVNVPGPSPCRQRASPLLSETLKKVFRLNLPKLSHAIRRSTEYTTSEFHQCLGCDSLTSFVKTLLEKECCQTLTYCSGCTWPRFSGSITGMAALMIQFHVMTRARVFRSSRAEQGGPGSLPYMLPDLRTDIGFHEPRLLR